MYRVMLYIGWAYVWHHRLIFTIENGIIIYLSFLRIVFFSLSLSVFEIIEITNFNEPQP